MRDEIFEIEMEPYMEGEARELSEEIWEYANSELADPESDIDDPDCLIVLLSIVGS